MNEIEKVIIIGGGPAGLAAATYASRGQLNPLVIEGSPAGGQLLLTTEVENYPGFPDGILGVQLVQNMRKQAEKFGTRFITDNVKSVTKRSDNTFDIVTTSEKTYSSHSVLIATGANARWLGIESEKTYMGKGVSACATCDGFFFRGKDVAIVGGGDTAMEEALFLTKFANKVFVIHRKDSFRASKIMQERVLAHEKIEVIYSTTVVEIKGDQTVNALLLKTEPDKTWELKVQGLFIAIGHVPSTQFLKETGVWIDDQGYIITRQRALVDGNAQSNIPDKKTFNTRFQYATNIEGLFAAGDCADPHYRQAATAVGMAVAAEIEIENYLAEK
jgi:thioredoxin reductase (NADPH)